MVDRGDEVADPVPGGLDDSGPQPGEEVAEDVDGDLEWCEDDADDDCEGDFRRGDDAVPDRLDDVPGRLEGPGDGVPGGGEGLDDPGVEGVLDGAPRGAPQIANGLEHAAPRRADPVDERLEALGDGGPGCGEGLDDPGVEGVLDGAPGAGPPVADGLEHAAPGRGDPVDEGLEGLGDGGPDLAAGLGLGEEVDEAGDQCGDGRDHQHDRVGVHHQVPGRGRRFGEVGGLDQVHDGAGRVDGLHGGLGGVEGVDGHGRGADGHGQGAHYVAVAADPVEDVAEPTGQLGEGVQQGARQKAGEVARRRQQWGERAAHPGGGVGEGLQGVPHGGARVPQAEQVVDEGVVLLEPEDGAGEISLGQDAPHAPEAGCRRALDPVYGGGYRVRDRPHEVGDAGLDVVDQVLESADDGRLQIARGSLDGLGRAGGRLGRLVRAELEHRVVELLGRDLAFFKGLTEITRVSARIEERLLDLPRRARNSVGELIEVLRREFSLARGLGQDHADAAEGFFVPPGHGIQIARGLRQFVIVLDAVGGQLRRHVLDIGQVVDGLVRVFLGGLLEPVDGGGVDPRELERGDELVGGVGRLDGLRREAADADGGAQRQ